MAKKPTAGQATPKELAEVVTDADVRMSLIAQQTRATLHAVRALMKQPDSIDMRMSVIDLVENLDAATEDAANAINSAAEEVGANDIGCVRREEDRVAVIAAVRACQPGIGSPASGLQ